MKPQIPWLRVFVEGVAPIIDEAISLADGVPVTPELTGFLTSRLGQNLSARRARNAQAAIRDGEVLVTMIDEIPSAIEAELREASVPSVACPAPQSQPLSSIRPGRAAMDGMNTRDRWPVNRHMAAWTLLFLIGCGSDSPTEPLRSQMLDIEVSGTVTLDGVPVSWPINLHYNGCEFGGDQCSNPSMWIVDQTQSGVDGTYRLSGQVPEDYCEGFPAIFIWVGDPMLFSWSPDCGQSVLDFPLDSADIYRR